MRLAALTVLLVLALAPAASAHAMLEGTTPERGAALATSPREVSFRFSEPVEGAFGAVRVFDARARRVDEGGVIRPGGDATVGVRLRSGLPDGTYVATYRVISADSHPVSGGVVFTVGRGGAAAPSVADLVGSGAGPVTQGAFGVARGLTYLATALLAGGLIFLLVVWHGGPLPAGAATRARRLVIGAAVVGVLAGLAGLVLQGATATGATFWSSLAPATIGQVLGTRFGRVWAARTIAFAVLGIAAGFARPFAALVAAATAVLVVAPSLGGHAAASTPAAALIGLDIVHVTAMSAWLGGLAALLFVVPAATRVLDPPDRSRLLASLLLRFSPLALACVIALIASGLAQSILHIDELSALTDTAFGRAVLVKVGLLAVLIGLGATQRRRVIPALRRVAETGASPGGAGRLLRSVLRAEVVLVVGVLAATSALVAYPPPDTLAKGPWSTTTRIGARTLEATLDPARVGPNELHLYLVDAKTGVPFDGTKELRVTAQLPDKRIGPLPAEPHKAGPGHYVVPALSLVPAGTWRIEVASRTSEFHEDVRTLEVEVK